MITIKGYSKLYYSGYVQYVHSFYLLFYIKGSSELESKVLTYKVIT